MMDLEELSYSFSAYFSSGCPWRGKYPRPSLEELSFVFGVTPVAEKLSVFMPYFRKLSSEWYLHKTLETIADPDSRELVFLRLLETDMAHT